MSWLYYLISLLSGAALTLQVGVNNQLREKVNSPMLSSLLSFSVGALCLGIVFAGVVLLLTGAYMIQKF
ncbi:DMT family transporter [Paenibacillus massiliensis]|uniref:DMT family transporter n=1 Tax=Paenibacillus massiliensis TaxID=225917 RepID=UPI0003783393|nr:DMT family transporter [Paenibacillus massiliensis]